MTDLQKFIELYKGFGIELEVTVACKYVLQEYPKCGHTIRLDEETHPSLSIGYGGFHSTIYFDTEGKFIAQGFWE